MENPVVAGELTVADLYLMVALHSLQPVLVGMHQGGIHADPKGHDRVIAQAHKLADKMLAERPAWLAEIADREPKPKQ